MIHSRQRVFVQICLLPLYPTLSLNEASWPALTCVCVCVCVPVPVPVSTLFNVSTSCPVVPQTVLQFKVTTHFSSRVVDLDLLDFIPRLLSIGSNTSDPHVLFQHRADLTFHSQQLVSFPFCKIHLLALLKITNSQNTSCLFNTCKNRSVQM